MFLSRYHLIPIHIIKIITMDYTPVVEYGVGTGYRNAQLFLILETSQSHIALWILLIFGRICAF
jgi:hypothetical protein